MTDKQIERLFWKWVARLRLQHWDITLYIEPELPSSGLTRTRWAYLSAECYINPLKAETEDIELTIVHELLHVWLSAWPQHDNEADNNFSIEERTVEEMSRMMLDSMGSLR